MFNFNGPVLVEGDSSIAISWASVKVVGPWRFIYTLKRDQPLVLIEGSFHHIIKQKNEESNALAVFGMDMDTLIWQMPS